LHGSRREAIRQKRFNKEGAALRRKQSEDDEIDGFSGAARESGLGE